MTEPVSTQLCAPWATRDDLPDPRPDLTDAEWDSVLLATSEILWALSGRQWSGTSTPPCQASATLHVDQGQCVGWWAGPSRYLPQQAAGAQRDVKLPHDEVTGIVSVTVGGAAFVDYERRGSWLHRTDGWGWGVADLDVVYTWGKAPPEAGRWHAVAYAVELAKARVGDSTCRLPKRVVSVTRQGVTIALLDPQRYLDKGKLGIPDIDQWLAAVNPNAIPERGTVWSPDVPRARLNL